MEKSKNFMLDSAPLQSGDEMAAWQTEKQNSKKRLHLLNPKDVKKTVDGKILRNLLPLDKIFNTVFLPLI